MRFLAWCRYAIGMTLMCFAILCLFLVGGDFERVELLDSILLTIVVVAFIQMDKALRVLNPAHPQ